MSDVIFAPLPNLPGDSVGVAAATQYQPDSLTISAPSNRALLDPLSATPVQLSSTPIFQPLSAAGVSGLPVVDFTQVAANAPELPKYSTPDLVNPNPPTQTADPVLGVAATSQLVSSPKSTLPDTIAPVVTMGLSRDTGNGIAGTEKDTLTRDISIQGTVQDDSRITRLQAQLDGGKVYNISPELRRNGKFSLDSIGVERLNGGRKLSDGQHTISILATDKFGNTSTPNNLTFTLDTIKPIKPGFSLTAASDTGILCDDRTTEGKVSLTGLTEANASVTIYNGTTNQTIQANATGQFTFTDIALKLGDNKLSMSAIDAAGNKSFFAKTISRTEIDPGDVITDWNATTLRAIQSSKTAPPIAAYNLAIVHGAVFDAVNSIEHKFKAYQVNGIAPANASSEAAAAAAAHQILVNLYPTQTAVFDAQLTKSLARVADGQAETDGVAFGKSIADQFLAWRTGDGSKNVVAYTPDPNKPEEWQPTAPNNAPALLPQWPGVKPFAMTSGDQFRPAAPPAMASAQYAAEYNFTKDFGAINSTKRTADQTETALFWADGGGTFTPPGHWNQITEHVVANQKNSLIDNARLFATLNISLADAGISCWDTKYTFKSCRPITAIQNGDKDNNPLTVGDTQWKPLIATPPFPEYSSGHSTFSGAASTVLTSFFGSNYSFSTTSLGLPGTTRQFTSFTQAADEAGMSRLYGGIHFMSANLAGLQSGRQLGSYVMNNFLKAV